MTVSSPFATADDYKRRYGDVDDEGLLLEVLMDATRLIAAELDRYGIPAEDKEMSDALMQVCRQVANRALDREEDEEFPIGVTQMTDTTGPFSHSYTVSSAYGDLYLTKAERRLLGIGRSRIRFVVPGGASDA